MWFKLASATFTNNLGTMSELSNSWMVSYSLNGGISKNSCPSSVKKNAAGTQADSNLTVIFTLASGATLNHIKAYVGGAVIASTTSGTSLTINASLITGPVTIEASATSAVVTPPPSVTQYTLTVNPNPSTATVKLNGSERKSITVDANTSVTYEVSASGYVTQSGSWTVTKTETKNISLEKIPSSGGDTTGTKLETPVISLVEA